jgi:hypothetical protein
MFVLSGSATSGKVLQLVVRKDGHDVPMALIEVDEWDSEGDVIAYTVWLDRDEFWPKPPDIFVYPHVRVVGVDRRVLERYMQSEGQHGLTRVVHDGQKTYIAHRIGCRIGYRDPWICYLLNGVTSEFNIVVEKTTLDDVKAYLVDKVPIAKREIMAWGHEGCKIYDLVRYGAVADGVTDDSGILLRVLDLVKTGDVITLPADRQIAVRQGIMVPSSVILDIRDEQIVVGE